MQAHLQRILKGVSRSFYLSIIFLPRIVRTPISLAFLCCKVADTIADTSIIPPAERLRLLEEFRRNFVQKDSRDLSIQIVGNSEEQELIKNIPQILQAVWELPTYQKNHICELVVELTQGMKLDLKYFPNETENQIRALQTEAELERYIYLVAGCVGKFWTRMMRDSFSFGKKFGAQMEELGEKLGKGLQLVNVLRDLPHDLKRGRCYISEDLLKRHQVTLEDLKNKNYQKTKPLFETLFKKTRDYLNTYPFYCDAFPWHALRLKMVVRLPARMGLQTIELLEQSRDHLDPRVTIKISRRQVYQTLIGSPL